MGKNWIHKDFMTKTMVLDEILYTSNFDNPILNKQEFQTKIRVYQNKF